MRSECIDLIKGKWIHRQLCMLRVRLHDHIVSVVSICGFPRLEMKILLSNRGWNLYILRIYNQVIDNFPVWKDGNTSKDRLPFWSTERSTGLSLSAANKMVTGQQAQCFADNPSDWGGWWVSNSCLGEFSKIGWTRVPSKDLPRFRDRNFCRIVQ